MKRRESSTSRGSKKSDTSLLRWVRDAQQAGESDIIVNVQEDNMHIWDVVFTANMFADANAYVFEFLNDDGTYQAFQDALQEPLKKLYDGYLLLGPGSTCFQYGDTFYEVYVYADGSMSQKNLSTDNCRQVRRRDLNDFANSIEKWFKQQRNGQVPGIHLRLCFFQDFPLSPPFVRVVCPRFVQWTGHVTIGGSICTEDLTASGWKPDMTVMGLLLQLKNNMVEGKAEIDMHNRHDYTEQEAQAAFQRVARDHGWRLPSQKTAAATSFQARPA